MAIVGDPKIEAAVIVTFPRHQMGQPIISLRPCEANSPTLLTSRLTFTKNRLTETTRDSTRKSLFCENLLSRQLVANTTKPIRYTDINNHNCFKSVRMISFCSSGCARFSTFAREEHSSFLTLKSGTSSEICIGGMAPAGHNASTGHSQVFRLSSLF